MFGSDWREQNREKKHQEELVKALIMQGYLKPPSGATFAQNENGLYDTVRPGVDQSTTPVVTPGMSFESSTGKLKEKPKAQMIWNPDKKKWEQTAIPEGFSGMDFQAPPAEKADKAETPGQKDWNKTYSAYIDAVTTKNGVLTETLQKQLDTLAPSSGYVPVDLPGPVKTNWRGTPSPTGERDPGPRVYMPKEDYDLRTQALQEMKASGFSEAQMANDKLVGEVMGQLRKPKKKK